ncbi:hypothetical protein [Labilibacter marinus]|uniref:hypothetical protein n=1 Tax=Labilibacter marinus TaxID=1477105 RepID=UPI00082D737D|nr:hypothetical protein [Labilibacter marinus]
MNKKVSDFLAFVKKNRLVIYVLVGTALMMQICSKGALPPDRTTAPQTQDVTILEEPEPSTQEPEQVPRAPKTDYTSLLIMTVAILSFFVAKRYGWLDKLFPKIVIFKVDYFRQKSTGNLIVKVFLINKTKSSISFNNPKLAFYKGSKKREFIIKNIGGENYFPITLTPGTGHKFNIDAQKFYNNVEGLDTYKSIQMEVTSTTGKSYKSMKWPTWLTFRRM